ncbi:MAG: hypothetical protein J0I13_02750 [Rhizobiales bacterium]|jgi:hypothetical protein|nr:hypothetical protein [Hyphomicrobiales bacterium]
MQKEAAAAPGPETGSPVPDWAATAVAKVARQPAWRAVRMQAPVAPDAAAAQAGPAQRREMPAEATQAWLRAQAYLRVLAWLPAPREPADGPVVLDAAAERQRTAAARLARDVAPANEVRPDFAAGGKPAGAAPAAGRRCVVLPVSHH